MLYDHRISCDTQADFEAAIEAAYQLSLATDQPLKIMGHCSPLRKGGDGAGGIMFGYMIEYRDGSRKQVIYSVHTTANYPIDHAIFDVSYDIQGRLRAAGKVVGFSDWEEDRVTHVLAIPWNDHDWEYGMVATDTEAVLTLLKHGGSSLRRARKETA